MRCFLAFCEEVSASPSAIRLLFRLIEHPRTTHLFTLAESKVSGASVKKNTKAIVCIGVSTRFFCQALPPLNVQTLYVFENKIFLILWFNARWHHKICQRI